MLPSGAAAGPSVNTAPSKIFSSFGVSVPSRKRISRILMAAGGYQDFWRGFWQDAQLPGGTMQDYYEPRVGEKAPNFRLPSTEGKELTLADFKGKDLVLYFYPKDDTPGCTKEACAFRDLSSDLTKAGAAVVGVSTDDLKSHQKFREKYNLNFPLLSDTTADVCKMFGAWKEKNLYGRRSWGVARKTILIGPDRMIRRVYNRVDPTTHGDQILRDLKELREGSKKKRA